MSKQIFSEKVQGCIWGVALGDAMGATVEKLSPAEIRERYGSVQDLNTEWWKQDLSHRKRGYGIFTDDTLMTLCLINVYAQKKAHIDAYDMADAMVKEIAYTTRWIPELEREDFLIERLFYPEKYIFLRHALANCEPREGGIGNMVNCGAAMYIAPIGVVNACDPESAYQEAISFAMGHQSSYGLEAAGVMAAAVAQAFVPETTVHDIVGVCIELAKDGTKQAILDITEKAAAMTDNEDPAVEFHKILCKYSSMGADIHRSAKKVGRATEDYTPGRCKSIEELPVALGYAVLHNGDFMQALTGGINSGRDTDSIGCMTGGILGALHGIAAIPEHFRQQIITANQIDITEYANLLSATALEIIATDAKKQKQWSENLSKIL